MPQATVNGALLNAGNVRRELGSRDLQNFTALSVSPYGIKNGTAVAPNNNADFGPDTPGTHDFGLSEAAATVAAGGEVIILGGAYDWTTTPSWANTYVLFQNLNYVDIKARRDALFTMPLDPSLSWGVNVGSNLRPPLILFSNCLWTHWTGGQFTQAAGVPVQRDPIFLIADSNTHFEIDHIYASNTNYFPILISGDYTDTTLNVRHSGAYSYIHEHDNVFVNNGYTGFPDGGGVRTQNVVSPNAACTDISLGLNDVVILTAATTGLYAYDFTNPTASTSGSLQRIDVWNPHIILLLGSSTQRLGLNVEGCNSPMGFSTDMTIWDPRVYGGFRGIQLSGGWNRVKIMGGTYDSQWTQGIQVYTSQLSSSAVLAAGTHLTDLWDVQIFAPTCINGNQSGGATTRASGLEIGFDANSTIFNTGPNAYIIAGTMLNISVYGGTYSDYQATPTQRYGITVLNNTGSGGGVLSGVFISGGTTFGNVIAGFAADSSQGTSYGVVVSNLNGYNPVAQIATPFVNANVTILGPYGNTATPLQTITYRFMAPTGVLTTTGGSGVSITVTAPNGTVLANGAATITSLAIPIGSTITFGSFGAPGNAPTVTCTMNGTALTNFFVSAGGLANHSFHWVGVNGGSASVPATDVLNKVYGTAIILVVSGGTVTAITIFDPNGKSFGSLGTSTTGNRIEPGFMYSITYSVAPTVAVYGT